MKNLRSSSLAKKFLNLLKNSLIIFQRNDPQISRNIDKINNRVILINYLIICIHN